MTAQSAARPNIVAAISTLLQIFWICIVGRHYGILLFSVTFFATLCFCFSIASRRVPHSHWYLRMVLGAMTGFAGGVLAALAAELALQGGYFFERAYPVQNLYFFPTLLLGWFYGALLFVVGPSVQAPHEGSL